MNRLFNGGILAGGIFAALIVFGFVMPREAWALAPAEWSMREQLIEEAKTAHNAGDHAKALAAAQKALALEASPSLHYFIAREEEETHAYAEGYATAQECRVEAEHDHQLHGREKLIEQCRDIENRLKARVGYVVVNVNDRPTGLRVKLSGQQLNEAALGIPYVITPGTIVVEASAPAHSPYRLEIDVPEGKTVNVSVTLAPQPVTAANAPTCSAGQRLGPQNVCVADSCEVGMTRTTDGLHCCWPGQSWQAALDRCAGQAQCPGGTHAEGDGCAADAGTLASPPAADASKPTEVAPLTSTAPASAGDQEAHRRLRPAYGLVGASVGAAVLVGSAVVWLIADSDFNSAKQSCNSMAGCTTTEYNSDVTTIRRLDKVSVTGFIVGGALTVAGGVLYWFSERRDWSTSERAWLDVDPLSRSARLSLRF